MEIFNSAKDLRVLIRTRDELVIDTPACTAEVEDQLGRFTLCVGGEPALAALVPSTIVLHKRNGSEVHIDITWGSLTAAANQVRVVVDSAEVHIVEAMRIAG